MRETRKKIRWSKGISENAGFSLIEVIIAMAVLALISIPLMKYFSDSMKYSAQMESQQQATILAQEITENLKSEEDILIRIPTGGAHYSVPYLTDAAMGYTVTEDHLLGDGTGSIVLTKTEGNYDIVITLSTSVPGDDITRPIEFGIDVSTDALAVERTQTTEAIAYFAAINSAYAAAYGSGALSQNQIQMRTDREIHMDIDMDGVYYVIRVYYEYSCSGLQGAGSTDSMTSSDLLNTKLASMKNIYLLYDKISETDESGNVKSDHITITRTPAVPITFVPELYLVCQNPPASAGYQLKVDGMMTGQPVHSNISPTEMTGQVVDQYSNLVTTQPLAGTGTPVRLVSIETEIYPKGHSAGDEPYITVTTTKGE